MLDTRLQERFTRSCTDAAFGYTAATTAAYAAFADQVFCFWADVFKPARDASSRNKSRPGVTVWGWPLPAPRQEPPPMPFMPFMPFPWAPPQRQPMPMGFPFAGTNPFAGANAAFSAWLGMFPIAAPPAAWPMAFMLMASGVPRSVAWPTAEANAAVMDAADAANASVQKVFSSYRTEGGHSIVRQTWPPAQAVMLALFVPLNIGAMMMSAFRVA